MKLKLYRSINEFLPSTNQGYRLKQIDKIKDQIQWDIENAGYKVTSESDKVLYILPEFDYLVKLKIDLLNDADGQDSDKYSLKVLDMHGKPIIPGIASTGSEELLSSIEKIGIAASDYLAFLKIDEFIKESYLTEGPVGNFFKTAFSKVSDAISKGLADRQDKKNSKELLSFIGNSFSSNLQEVVKSLSKEGATAQVRSEISSSGRELNITINGFAAAITWGIDPSLPKAIGLIASQIRTAFGSWQIPANRFKDSVKIVLNIIGKKLKISFTKIDLEYKEEQKNPSGDNEDKDAENNDQAESDDTKPATTQKTNSEETDTDASKTNDNAQSAQPSNVSAYSKKLSDTLPDTIKNILYGESYHKVRSGRFQLRESSRVTKGKPYSVYENAFKAGDANSWATIMKIFFEDQLKFGEGKIPTLLINGAVKSALEKGISPKTNNDIAYFLNYCDKYKQPPKDFFFDVLDSLEGYTEKFVDLVNGQSVADAIDRKISLLYTKDFWNSSNLTRDLIQLYKLFYTASEFQEGRYLPKVIEQQQRADADTTGDIPNTRTKEFLGQDFSYDPKQLRKAILMDNGRLRNLRELLALKNAIDDDNDVERESGSAKKNILGTENKNQKKDSLTSSEVEKVIKAIKDQPTVKDKLSQMLQLTQDYSKVIDNSKVDDLINAFVATLKRRN